MPIAQGRHGYVSIGGTEYPFLSWSMLRRRGLVAPQGVGQSWATHHGESVQSTRFVGKCLVRRKATEFLNTTWWDRFLTRTWSGGFDDTSTATIIAANGKRAYTLADAKAESFIITATKNAIVGIDVVFVAPALPTRAAHTPSDYTHQMDNTGPLMGHAVTTSGMGGNPYRVQLGFANNHQPNGVMDGTGYLTSWDAGPPTASLAITFDAQGNAQPFADDASLTMALVGAATVTFTCQKVVPDNPDDLEDVTPGQHYQTFQCLVKGTTTTKPVTYAVS